MVNCTVNHEATDLWWHHLPGSHDFKSGRDIADRQAMDPRLWGSEGSITSCGIHSLSGFLKLPQGIHYKNTKILENILSICLTGTVFLLQISNFYLKLTNFIHPFLHGKVQLIVKLHDINWISEKRDRSIFSLLSEQIGKKGESTFNKLCVNIYTSRYFLMFQFSRILSELCHISSPLSISSLASNMFIKLKRKESWAHLCL